MDAQAIVCEDLSVEAQILASLAGDFCIAALVLDAAGSDVDFAVVGWENYRLNFGHGNIISECLSYERLHETIF